MTPERIAPAIRTCHNRNSYWLC